ncbi:hypothetical protein [Saliphagus sp. LR7]|uniref:hypothetical protein n=1 Tax=Saliphagus sp. LR7 TaxID=2282654 RepID=UPI000DF7D0C7|nr:hypothetical protein [Saliphagus sp. LR7]
MTDHDSDGENNNTSNMGPNEMNLTDIDPIEIDLPDLDPIEKVLPNVDPLEIDLDREIKKKRPGTSD